jgi:hypothetical protein
VTLGGGNRTFVATKEQTRRCRSPRANTGAASSLTATLGSTPTTGSVILAFVSWNATYTPTISSVQDDNSNSLTLVPGTLKSYVDALNITVQSGIFAYVVPAAPSKTFTVNGSPGTRPSRSPAQGS